MLMRASCYALLMFATGTLLGACGEQSQAPAAVAQEPDAPARETFLVEADPERGRTMADLWCASCHRVSPQQPPQEPAPSFMEIAAEPGRDAAYLRAFMADLHLPMPTFRLYPDEQEHVIAYIRSLAPSP